MSDTIKPGPLAGSDALWETLTRESGCAIYVVAGDGRFVYANERSRAWMAWRRGSPATDDAPYSFDDTCAPALQGERLSYIRRVCDERVQLVYESINRSIRFLVSIRPTTGPGGETLALVLSRRLRPWERVTAGAYPGAVVVEPEQHDAGVLELLSPRELEVLILIGEGMSYADIAKRLHRSVRTIERHRDRLGQKLGANDRVDIARFAFRAGLAEMPEPADESIIERMGYDPLNVSEPVKRLAKSRPRRKP